MVRNGEGAVIENVRQTGQKKKKTLGFITVVSPNSSRDVNNGLFLYFALFHIYIDFTDLICCALTRVKVLYCVCNFASILVRLGYVNINFYKVLQMM